MKTSFYFVLWILIYPILGLLNNSFIDNNAFMVAFAIVWGISWLLNQVMPKTIYYERTTQNAPILEDVYTCNVASFKRRLSKQAIIETITVIYFIITMIAIALLIGINDWFALLIFGIFAATSIAASVKLIKAKLQLQANPTPEQCLEIAEETYNLDYTSYYEARTGVSSYNDTLPPKPRYFTAFRVFSILISLLSSLLGLLYIVSGIILMVPQSPLELGTLGGMSFLYGSLATYFGIKDFISCIQPQKKSAPSEQKNNTLNHEN